MKPHLSCKSFFTVLVPMVVLSLAAGRVNSATTVNYHVSASANDGYALIADKGIQDNKGSSLISLLQAEEGYSTFFTEDSTYPNYDGWAWAQGQQTLDSNSLYIGTNNREYFVPYPVSAMKFGTLAVFRGLDVISAGFRMYSGDEMNDGRVYGTIHGGLPGWPYVFQDISQIEKTQASVDWDHIDAWEPNTWYYSPGLTNIVQELVNKPDWKIGRPMTMVYSTREKSPSIRSFLSSERGYTLAPKLRIRFRACVIFGYVRTAEGEPIDDAIIDGGEDLERRTTFSDGEYQFFVPPGWSGTLTASKDDIVFKPAQYTYTDLNTHMFEQNFIEYKPQISGFVLDKHGSGLEQANVSANNGGASGLTDANGFYEILVPLNWSGTVTAYKSGWKITPEGVSYNNLVTDQNDQNYSAYQPTISGHAKDKEGILLPGVKIDVEGIAALFTDVNGYYRIDVRYMWSGQITASMTDFGFLPYYRSYNKLTIDKTDQDFTSFQPKISGYVTSLDGGSVIAGVEVSADSIGVLVTTDFNGYYEFVVPYGWSGTVTLTCPWESWGFIPPGRSYSNVIANKSEQNYQGFQPTITGHIRNGPVYLGDVTVTAEGIGTYYSLAGSYRFTVPSGWSGTITPSRPGYSFRPPSRTHTNVTSDLYNQDFVFFRPVITGHIYDTDGDAIEAVLVSADNNGGSDTTDINGYYSIIVPYEWSGIVTVGKDGWLFAPNQSVYENVIENLDEENYIGFQPKISGCIRKRDGSGLEGVSVPLNNNAGSTVTDSNGCYVAGVPYQWSGLISVIKNEWGFDPNQRAYLNVTSDQTEQNYTAFQPIISGYLTGPGGVGVMDVSVSTKDQVDSYTSDANGYYKLTVPYRWSGTVTPTKIAWVFEPNERTYTNVTTDQTNQDYTALAPPLISGYIRDSNQEPVCDALVSTIDGTDSDTTDANGYYELTVPQDWSGTVVPEKTFWSFEPTELTYENLTEDTPNQNFTGIPDVIISGYVTTVGGKSIRYVYVKAEDIAGHDTTDVNGFYELSVPPGFSGKVTPSLDGYPPPPAPPPPWPGSGQSQWYIQRKFEPQDRTYNNLTKDMVEQNFLVLGIKVRADGTGDCPTIQCAVDAALDGDEVILEPGRYRGAGNYDIEFRGKAITVRSIKPNAPAVVAATIIDANTFGIGFHFHTREDANSVVDGITIINGQGFQGYSPSIGGIYCYDTSPMIRNCVIRECFGAGIALSYSNAIIKNCVIRENRYSVDRKNAGAGIYCWYSSPLISNCIISNNFNGGLQIFNDYPKDVNFCTTVINCMFTGNRGSYNCYYGGISFGGGILFKGGNISVINCTFSGNIADVGGGICSYGGRRGAYMSNMTISNCIFRANDANVGPQIALKRYYYEPPPAVSVSYSDVEGGHTQVVVDPCCTLNWDNDTNLDIDPCFAVPGYWHTNDTPEDVNDDFWINGDYHLKSEAGRWDPNGETWIYDTNISPCIDAGDPNSDWTAELWPHGQRINMGVCGGTPEASMSLSDAGNISDLNGDDSVGYEDFVLFLGRWLYEAVLLAEDLNRDGFVNFTDVAIFANNWQGRPAQATNPNPPDGATVFEPNLGDRCRNQPRH